MMHNEMILCRGCGKEIHRTASTCPQCGASQRTTRYKSKTAAGVLAIFLGGLGIHRFYLGQWWGIFYLLLIWTMIPSLVSLIEGIVFLFSDENKWDDKYNDGMPGQGESGVGLVIAVIASVMFIVAIIGILAAIAIPAYHDYTIRAKVAQAMAAGDDAKQRVEKYAVNKKSWPSSNKDIALPEIIGEKYIEAVNIGKGGSITIQLSKQSGLVTAETIVLTPRIDDLGKLVWSCSGGTLAEKYRSQECRE